MLLPKNEPKSFYITLKIGKTHPVDLVRSILDIIQVPFRIFLDVFAITESSTRPDPWLLHPSVATAFNKTTLIKSFDDENDLIGEIQNEDLFSKILEKHHITRRYIIIFLCNNISIHYQRRGLINYGIKCSHHKTHHNLGLCRPPVKRTCPFHCLVHVVCQTLLLLTVILPSLLRIKLEKRI